MKIAILTDVIDRAQRGTGVPSYGKYLIEALVNLGVDVYVVHFKENDCFIYKKAKEILIKPTFGKTHALLFKLPKILKQKEIDAIHLLAPTFYEAPAMILKVKKIVTFHDIRNFVKKRKFKFSPDVLKRIIKEKIKEYLFSFTAKKADKIITVSFNTKKDLIEVLKVDEEKIQDILSATDKKIDKKDFPLPRSSFVSSEYVLGSEQNLQLLNIFLGLKKKGVEHKLVIFGEFGKLLLDQLKKFIKENDLKNDVIFTGYIPELELLKLYSNADLLIHHVDYEGFGLPPLEAMSCGCPVLTARVASLPEVVGQAGVLLEPFKIQEWVNVAYEILKNEGKREIMREKGFARAKDFSWGKTAQKTKKVYEDTTS